MSDSSPSSLISKWRLMALAGAGAAALGLAALSGTSDKGPSSRSGNPGAAAIEECFDDEVMCDQPKPKKSIMRF